MCIRLNVDSLLLTGGSRGGGPLDIKPWVLTTRLFLDFLASAGSPWLVDALGVDQLRDDELDEKKITFPLVPRVPLPLHVPSFLLCGQTGLGHPQDL